MVPVVISVGAGGRSPLQNPQDHRLWPGQRVLQHHQGSSHLLRIRSVFVGVPDPTLQKHGSYSIFFFLIR